MEHAGSGETVKTTSSLVPQPFACMTVRRRVALEDDTCAVVFKDAGESIVAVPDRTLQVVEAIGKSPWVAVPWSAKAVEFPWEH